MVNEAAGNPELMRKLYNVENFRLNNRAIVQKIV